MKIQKPYFVLFITSAFVFSCSQEQDAGTARSTYTKKSSSSGADSEAAEVGSDDATGTSSTVSSSTSSSGSTSTGSTSSTSNSGSTSTSGGTSTGGASASAANGNVTVSLTYVKPATNGTHYMAGHVRAAWITVEKDGKDVYVRTLESFGNTRSSNLRRWVYFAGDSFVDGVTQATKPYVTNSLSDPNASLTWDMKDKVGTVQTVGKYKMWFELATGNTSAVNTAKILEAQSLGNGYDFYYVPFELTAAATTVQDNKSKVFTNIKIVHSVK